MLRKNIFALGFILACQPAQTPSKKESPKADPTPSLVSKEDSPKEAAVVDYPKPAIQEAVVAPPKEVSWQKAPIPEAYDILAIFGSNSALYAVDHADGGFLSKDGKTFEQVEIPAKLKSKDDPSGAQNVVYGEQLAGGEIFLSTENGLSGDSNIFYSFDNGANFTSQEGTAGFATGFAGNAADGYFAAASSLLQSTDKGKTWSSVKLPSTEMLHSVTMSTSALIVVGDKGTIITSSDKGKTWLQAPSATTEKLNTITSNKDEVYAAGDKGAILYSKDGGKTFSVESSGTSKSLYRITFVAGQVVASGDGGTVVSKSADGTWKTEDSGASVSLKAMHVVGDTLWLGGEKGMLLSRVLK